MGQTVRSLGKLDGFDPWLVEQNGSLKHIHGRRIQARSEIDIAAPIWTFAFDYRGGRFAGQTSGVEQIVVLKNANGPGPLECCERRLDWASQCIIEGKQAGSLASPEHKMRKSLRTVGEGADNQCLGSGHEENIAYGTNSDLGSTRTIHRPELMSGT